MIKVIGNVINLSEVSFCINYYCKRLCVRCLIIEKCECIGKNNKQNDGSKCAVYNGYNDGWYNGIWCYATTEICSDARAHISEDLLGFGPSRHACKIGTIMLVSLRELKLS